VTAVRVGPSARARVVELMRRMPKVELHVHLEGTLAAQRVIDAARRDGVSVDPAELRPLEAGGDRSFDAFLRSYMLRYYALRTPDDYAAAVDDLLAAQAAQNVPYTEAFVTFEGALRGAYVLRDVLAAMAAVERSWHARGVALRLIADAPRTLGAAVADQLFRLAAADPTGLCVGVGIGGDEAVAPGDPFEPAFHRAREMGLRLTAHAGEHAGAAAVAHAVDRLGVERIGHGLGAAVDPGLLDRLRALEVSIDCCPTSNRLTGAWDPSSGPHPLRAFVAAGVRVDIGSDDPACFGTTLTEEWASLVLEQGLSLQRCLELTLASVDACFLDAPARTRLRAQFEADLVDLRDVAAEVEVALTT
jgi:adenosine deaminase